MNKQLTPQCQLLVHHSEASLKKKFKWYTQHFQGEVVEKSRSQMLVIEEHWERRFNCCKMLRDHRQKCKQVHVTGI